MSDETSLYRYYNSKDELLYIGISMSAIVRAHQHKRKEWFASVCKITIERYPDRDEALLAETDAIINERPLYNIHKQLKESKTDPEKDRFIIGSKANREMWERHDRANRSVEWEHRYSLSPRTSMRRRCMARVGRKAWIENGWKLEREMAEKESKMGNWEKLET